MTASDLRSPATCARSRSHRSRTSDAGSVPDQGDRRVDLGATRRHPRIAGGDGVLDDALGRRRRLVIPAGRPVDDDPQPPRACQSCAIAGRFEDRDRVRCCFERAGARARVAGIDLDVPLAEDGAGFQSCIPDRGRCRRRLVEGRTWPRQTCPAPAGPLPRSTCSSIRSGSPSSRSAAARANRFVAAGRSPRAKARRPAAPRRWAARVPICRPSASIGPSSARYRNACSRW